MPEHFYNEIGSTAVPSSLSEYLKHGMVEVWQELDHIVMSQQVSTQSTSIRGFVSTNPGSNL